MSPFYVTEVGSICIEVNLRESISRRWWGGSLLLLSRIFLSVTEILRILVRIGRRPVPLLFEALQLSVFRLTGLFACCFSIGLLLSPELRLTH